MLARSGKLLALLRESPAWALYSYLTEQPEAIRVTAVQQFSAGSRALIARLEQRRSLASREAVAIRKRAYSAHLLLDHLDVILSVAKQLNLPFTSVSELGSARARALIAQVPIFLIERELGVRTESEQRPIEENDLRDIAALCTVLSYADVIVGEKPFLDRARQAKLGERYATRLLKNVTDIQVAMFP